MPERKRMTTRLKDLFARPEIFVIAGGVNAIAAKMAEVPGYEAFYMSGEHVGAPAPGPGGGRGGDGAGEIARAAAAPPGTRGHAHRLSRLLFADDRAMRGHDAPGIVDATTAVARLIGRYDG